MAAAPNAGRANIEVPHRNWIVERIPPPPKPKEFVVDVPLAPSPVEPVTELKTVVPAKISRELDNFISQEMLVDCYIPPVLIEMAQTIYIDETMPVMVDKVDLVERSTCPVDIELFWEIYAPKMNESAEKLMSYKFCDVKEAHLVLCQMIRSFVPNLAAHLDSTYKYKSKYCVSFSCSTKNHMAPRVACDCPWSARLEQEEDGFFYFTKIDSFELHCAECLKNRARFSTTEVDFQNLFPPRSRSQVARILKQFPVSETTMTMRRNRCKTLLTDSDRVLLTDRVKDLDVDPEVCNIPVESVGRKEEPNEAYRLLQLLSYFNKEDHARTKAFFCRDEKERLCLSMLAFIWPEGQSLLASHSDVIFCDSMWAINEDGDHILTIVVEDKEEKLRLAASAIAFHERGEQWELFFEWVKNCIGGFASKCQCIVTDGADYIHKAFVNKVKTTALHVSCWWHKNRAVRKWVGALGATARSILTMVWADSVEELTLRENKALEMISELEQKGIRDASVRKREIQKLCDSLAEINDKTFITLPVFTGGTLSNSYAESINSCLRKAGLNAFTSRLNSIMALRNYCTACTRSIIGYSRQRRLLLDHYMKEGVTDTVSRGVLLHQAEQLEEAENICTLLSEQGSSFVVEELIQKKIQADLLIKRRAQRRVTWNEATEMISCSCNGLVYRGMPCMHIALVAKEKDYKIPLSLFNSRFWYQVPVALPVEPGARPLLPPPEQPPLPSEPSDNARFEVVTVSGSELHITEAFMNERFGDEKSIRARGDMRAIELLFLTQVLPYSTDEERQEITDQIRSVVESAADRLQGGRREQQVLVPHAARRNRKTSYMTVPRQLARATGEAIERHTRTPMPEPGSPDNKRSHIEGEE